MTSRKDYGHADSGVPITDAVVEELANEAERGFDIEEVLGRRGRRGRPPLGSAAAAVESVRLDPELRERLARRAQEEGVSVSEVIREALRQHLEAS